MSAHGAATVLNMESLGIIFCFSLFIIIVCLTVNEKHKHYLVWELIVSAHGVDTVLNRQRQKNDQGKPCLSLHKYLCEISSYGKACLRLCSSSMS